MSETTMAIGERIRFFRNLKGMAHKFLGVKVGFPEKPLTSAWLNMSPVQEHPNQI